MPHELTELRLDAVTRPAAEPTREITADVCVVGAGIAGSTAAIESARLGRSVVLIDSLPLIGGQMVHSLIGLFCGIFGNAPEYTQLTHGVFDDIFAALGPSGDLYFSRGHTTTVFYNEVALGRWLEKTVQSLGIQVITGAVLGDVSMRDGFVTSADFGTRYGNVRVRASGYVDASGDAALTWQAGLPCWEPSRPIYGSQQFIVENLHEEHKPEAGEVDAVFAARGEESGLLRRGGLAFFFPGRGTAVMNVTHIDAPLDPISASRAMFEGRDQADRALELLRAEFPKAFGEARVRAYGFPGRRQTRWIKGAHQLTVDEVRSGTAVRRRGGADRVAGRAARPVGRLRVGDVPGRSRALRAAALAAPAGRAQPGRGRPVRGRRRRRAVERAGDGAVLGDGGGRRARARPGRRLGRRPGRQRARHRRRAAAAAARRQPGRPGTVTRSSPMIHDDVRSG